MKKLIRKTKKIWGNRFIWGCVLSFSQILLFIFLPQDGLLALIFLIILTLLDRLLDFANDKKESKEDFNSRALLAMEEDIQRKKQLEEIKKIASIG